MLTKFTTYSKRIHELLEEDLKKLTTEEGSEDYIFTRMLETSITFLAIESKKPSENSEVGEELMGTIYSHVFGTLYELKERIPKYEEMTAAKYYKNLEKILKKLYKEYSDEDFKGEEGMAEAVEFVLKRLPK